MVVSVTCVVVVTVLVMMGEFFLASTGQQLLQPEGLTGGKGGHSEGGFVGLKNGFEKVPPILQ